MNTPSDWVGNDQRRDVMQHYKKRIDNGVAEDTDDYSVESPSFPLSPPQRAFKTPPMRSPQRHVRLVPTLSWKPYKRDYLLLVFPLNCKPLYQVILQ